MARDSGIALGSLIAAKIVCCGGFALAATGMLSGLGAWLTDSGTDATAGQYARPVP
jgi:hypothetical protein